MGRPKHRLSKGQPRGARTASGRKRDRTPLRVLPCEGVQRRHDLYRPTNDNTGRKMTDTCDAIGRAYNAGLLSTNPDRALNLLNAGRKIAAQYWRIFPGMLSPDSLARFQAQEGGASITDEERLRRERINEDALNDGLAMVKARGRDVRKAFDQLVIDFNPDDGPRWLDQIVWAERHNRRANEGDYNMLRLAIEGLEALA